MTPKPLNFRKKLGLFFLGLVGLYWLAFPVISVMDIPHKVWVLAALAIAGEGLTVLTIAILGKEYWQKIKDTVKQRVWQKK